MSVLVLHNLFNESAIIKLSSEMSSGRYIISFKELKVRMDDSTNGMFLTFIILEGLLWLPVL